MHRLVRLEGSLLQKELIASTAIRCNRTSSDWGAVKNEDESRRKIYRCRKAHISRHDFEVMFLSCQLQNFECWTWLRTSRNHQKRSVRPVAWYSIGNLHHRHHDELALIRSQLPSVHFQLQEDECHAELGQCVAGPEDISSVVGAVAIASGLSRARRSQTDARQIRQCRIDENTEFSAFNTAGGAASMWSLEEILHTMAGRIGNGRKMRKTFSHRIYHVRLLSRFAHHSKSTGTNHRTSGR